MKNAINPRRKFFFSNKRFPAFINMLIGAGSIMDISGSYYNKKNVFSDEYIDSFAIWDDWNKVGGDIYVSLQNNLKNIKDPVQYESTSKKLRGYC